jgi:lipopolysaccharide O-acetyltransferase
MSNNFRRIYNTYGVFSLIHLVLSWIYTKLFFPRARLIRLPFEIRNRNKISIGRNFTSGVSCRLEAISISNSGSLIQIGDNVQINDFVHIGAIDSITICDNVLIASKVFISDHNHGSYSLINSESPLIAPIDRSLNSRPVLIEENSWIGESVCILPGVTIGKGSIVGANSVVTKSIPAFCIAVGNPAKLIKKFDWDKNTWVII